LGCGDVCDTQYLLSGDVLGTQAGQYPRHAKRYADFMAVEAALQAKRVDAFRAFAADVAARTYPQPQHEVRMPAAEIKTFAARAQSI
jgi:3-methyl-2-oxobutanoate hydroxymethyltransferase